MFDRQNFTMLVQDFEKQHFFDLPQHYPSERDEEMVLLEVVTNDGVRVVTTHNWASTPSELRMLQWLVDFQSYRMNWADPR